MKPFAFVLLFSTLFSLSAGAEYRVFLLKFSKQPKAPAAGEAPEAPAEPHYLESTLDPEQYRGYFPVAQDERVTYVATWRCYGRTENFKPHCPNPRGPASAEPTVPEKTTGLDLAPPAPAAVAPPAKP